MLFIYGLYKQPRKHYSLFKLNKYILCYIGNDF